MQGDRRLYELLEKGIDSIDKLAANVEKLTTEPMMELEEPTPPQCPHCRTINPEILVQREEGSKGNLISFILNPICGHCKKPFWVLFTGWAIYPTRESARDNGKILLEGMMGKVHNERNSR